MKLSLMPISQIGKHSGYEVGAVGEAQHECSVVVITRRCQRLNAGSTPAARIFIDNDTQVSRIGNMARNSALENCCFALANTHT